MPVGLSSPSGFSREDLEQMHAGALRVLSELGLAVDNPTAVKQFLARSPVGYTIGLAGYDGSDLSRKLGNTAGAMPFTAVFNRQGAVVQRKLGTTSVEELESWTQRL